MFQSPPGLAKCSPAACPPSCLVPSAERVVAWLPGTNPQWRGQRGGGRTAALTSLFVALAWVTGQTALSPGECLGIGSTAQPWFCAPGYDPRPPKGRVNPPNNAVWESSVHDWWRICSSSRALLCERVWPTALSLFSVVVFE